MQSALTEKPQQRLGHPQIDDTWLVSGYSTMMDISMLAEDTYLVGIHTPAGVVAMKLVVQ